MALGEMNKPPAEELEDAQQSLKQDEFRPKSVQFCSLFFHGQLYVFLLA